MGQHKGGVDDGAIPAGTGLLSASLLVVCCIVRYSGNCPRNICKRAVTEVRYREAFKGYRSSTCRFFRQTSRDTSPFREHFLIEVARAKAFRINKTRFLRI